MKHSMMNTIDELEEEILNLGGCHIEAIFLLDNLRRNLRESLSLLAMDTLTIQEAESVLIERRLHLSSTLSDAAKTLGIERSTLYRKIKRFGISWTARVQSW